QVGVDVHLAHAVLDAFLDLFHGHAVGFLDFAAKLVDHLEPFLRHGAGAVHDQVGVGQAAVDFGDAAYGQNVARGRAGDLVGAVAGAHGDGQGVHLGVGDKARGFFGVGE